METYHAYFDASVRGEQYYLGYVVYDKDQQVVMSKTVKYWNTGFSIKENDSNMAEYLSLLQLLNEIKNNGIRSVEIMGDNKAVINTCVRRSNVQPRYKLVHREIIQLMRSLDYINLQFVKRNNNKVADRMCRKAYKAAIKREVALCV